MVDGGWWMDRVVPLQPSRNRSEWEGATDGTLFVPQGRATQVQSNAEAAMP